MKDPVVVIDNGGGAIKLGLAGEKEPRAVFPNGVGRCKADKKVYQAHKIDDCQDIAALVRTRSAHHATTPAPASLAPAPYDPLSALPPAPLTACPSPLPHAVSEAAGR